MDLDTAILALRVAVALAAVFGALFFAHRWITKGRPGGPAKAKQIAVVARQGLGAKAGVALVEAGGRRYLLGVTEHAVTVLDAFGQGEAPAAILPASVDGQAVTAVRFEQELRTVTIATGDLPVLTGGDVAPPTLAIPAPVPASAAPTSRRAAREAEQRRAHGGPLAGSVLSPSTWRQTFDAIKQVR